MKPNTVLSVFILVCNILGKNNLQLTGCEQSQTVRRAFKHWAGARCGSVVRAFAHGAMGRRINPSWGGPIELFLVPVSAPRLV